MFNVYAISWAEARTTAHVMEFAGNGEWRSVCGYRVRRSHASLHLFLPGDGAPNLPDKPWCSRCTALLTTAIATYTAAGFGGDP